jgi:hypothetical protein
VLKFLTFAHFPHFQIDSTAWKRVVVRIIRKDADLEELHITDRSNNQQHVKLDDRH